MLSTAPLRTTAPRVPIALACAKQTVTEGHTADDKKLVPVGMIWPLQ